MITSFGAFLHHVFAFMLVASLIYEFIALCKEISFEETRGVGMN
jgi:hypothetical protein